MCLVKCMYGTCIASWEKRCARATLRRDGHSLQARRMCCIWLHCCDSSARQPSVNSILMLHHDHLHPLPPQ